MVAAFRYSMPWICVWILFAAAPNVGSAQEAPDGAPPSSEAQIGRWVDDLGHDRYLRRETANRKLVAIGTDAIAPLIAALDSGDLEVIERAIDVITEIGITNPPSDDGGAWDQLSRLAEGRAGQTATRAQIALAEIRNHRSIRAMESLKEAGIVIADSVFALSAVQPSPVVTIGDDWNEDLESLQWLRWLYGVENARVQGKAGAPEVIEQVVKIPDLKSVSFVETKIDQASLRPLKQLKRIYALEFRYVDLDDQYGPLIAELPIRLSLDLMGTGISNEAVEAMKNSLPGLQITHRQGGFLGVQCAPTDDICQIISVVEGSAAQQAGLLAGDVIVHVGKSPVRRFIDLQQEINRHVPGDSIEVRLRRNGQEKTLQLQLGRFEGQ